MAKVGLKEAGIGLSLVTGLPVLALWNLWNGFEKIAMNEQSGAFREYMMYSLKIAASCIVTGAFDQAYRILEAIKQPFLG